MTTQLYDYIVAHGHNIDPLLQDLDEETERLGFPTIQTSPEAGTFFTILTRAISAKSAVEVGTFTGHSSVCIARGLATDGKLLCLDVSEQYTAVARRYWKLAGLQDRISLKLGPALESLRMMPAEEMFDLGYIDADKPNYSAYYEEILKRLRPNGLILVDNVLWGGSVADRNSRSRDTQAIRRLNDLIASDQRVDAVLLPVSDGITIARKK